MKEKVKVPDLITILIKPVQRLFKYPLFIGRLIDVSFAKMAAYL
jgi:hypothetical protein